MVTIQQAQTGIARFIDSEIVPRLSVVEKVVIGGGGALLTAKLPSALDALMENKLIGLLGIYDRERGEIDIDALYEAVKPYLGVDPIPLKIPFLGITLKFTQREFETLYQYIKEA